MADEKTRTIGEVYNKLKQISAEDGVDFGLDDYTEESFSKKYGTARGTEQLYNTLKKISDEDGVDFGLPENVIDWQTSFDRGERNAKQQGEGDAALVSRVLNEGGTAADSSDARAAAQRMSGGTADTDPKYEELFGSEADRNPVGVIYNADDDKYEIVPYGEMYTLDTDDEGNETVGLRGAFWSGKGAHSKFYTLDTRPMKVEDEATIKKDAYERYTLPTGQEVLRYKTIHLDGKNGLNEIEGEYAIDPRDGRLHEVLWQDADKARRAAVDKESVRAGVMRREEEANALEGSLDRVEERTRQAFSDYLSQNGVQLPDGVDIMSLGKMADVAVVNPILSMAVDKIMPIEYREAARAVSEARDMIEQARTNTSDKTDLVSWMTGGARNLKSGVGNKLFDFRTWDFGITDARSALAMKRAADKFERGESLTAGEQAMMDAMANKLAVEAFFGSDLGYLYEAGQVTAESIPFMLEFIATEGAMAGADAATKSLVKYATKRFSKGAMREAARKAYNSAVGKVVRTVGDASLKGSVQAATIGAPRVVANAAERMTGEQQIGTDENGDVKTTGFTDKQDAGRAWLSAFGQQSVEWQSERMSEVLSPLLKIGKGGRLLKKFDGTVVGEAIEAMRSIPHSRAVQVMKGMERRMGWHGVTGEFFEEIVGGVENSLLGLDDTTLDTNYRTGLFNPDKMLRTFLGVGVMGGMFSTANTLGYMRSARKHGNIVREGDRLFGTDDAWITLVRAGETVKGDDFSGLVDATKTILQGNYRKSQKKVALDYANSVAWLKGAEGEQAKAISELSPEQLEAQANIEEGYKAEEPGELREIATGAAQAAEVFRERNSALADTAEQMWKDGASDAEMFGFFDGLSAEDRELAEEWYAAVKRQEGVEMGTQEQIDEQTKDFQDFVDDNSAEGVITTGVYKGGEVIVKSMSEEGGVATLADGRVVPLDAIENIQQFDAEEVKADNIETTTAAVQQERDMMQQHHEKTHLPGPDEVFYLNPENPTAYRAAQQDGMWVLIPEDNPDAGQSMSEEDLLNAMDEYWDGAEAIANGEAINENENENQNGQLPEEAIEPQQEYDTIQTGDGAEARIPVFINDEGERERDYEAVEPAVAYAGMVEEAGSEDAAEQAAGIVAQNIEKDIAKARKWKPDASLKSYKKIAAAIRANNEEIQALEKRHKFWSDLANYRNSLAEAAAAAEKQAKSESKKKGNKSGKKKGDKNEPEKGTIQWREKQLGDYLNFEDYVLRVMAGGGTRVVWKDNPTTGTRGLASHTVGNIESERKKRIGILATSKKGGKYPEELAEWLWQGYKEAMNTDSDQIGQDAEDNAFNTVVGVLLRHATRGAMIAEAEARHGNAINAEREAEENYTEEDWNAEKQQIFAEQEGFATYEDYLDDIDIRNEEIALTNADMQEINAIFAEDWQSNGIESLFTDNGNNSINSENNGEEAILDAGGTRRGTGMGEESDEGAAQGGAEESGALGEEGASVAPGSAERPDGSVRVNGRQGGSSSLDAAVEPVQGNGQAGGRRSVEIDRESIRVLLREAGAEDLTFVDRMSDEEVRQLSGLIDTWEEVNTEYGRVQEEQAKALKSRNKAERERAQSVVDAAQAAADTAFKPIADFVYQQYYKEAEAEIKDIESQLDGENTPKNDDLIQRIADMMGEDFESVPDMEEDPRAAARYAAAEKWMEANVWDTGGSGDNSDNSTYSNNRGYSNGFRIGDYREVDQKGYEVADIFDENDNRIGEITRAKASEGFRYLCRAEGRYNTSWHKTAELALEAFAELRQQNEQADAGQPSGLTDKARQLAEAASRSKEAWRTWLMSPNTDTTKESWTKALDELRKSRGDFAKALREADEAALAELEQWADGEREVDVLEAIEKERRRRENDAEMSRLFDERLSGQSPVERIAATGKVRHDDFTNKDEAGNYLTQGVYHAPEGYAVATDGKVLIADKRAYDKKSKGKVIASHKVGDVAAGEEMGKDGLADGLHYPNWKAVIDNAKNGTSEVAVDWAEIAGFVNGAMKRIQGGEKTKAAKQRAADGIMVIRMADGGMVGVKLGNMAIVANAAVSLGAKKVWYGAPDRALYTEGKDGMTMVMPVLIDADTFRREAAVVYDLAGRAETNGSGDSGSSIASSSSGDKVNEKGITTNPTSASHGSESSGSAAARNSAGKGMDLFGFEQGDIAGNQNQAAVRNGTMAARNKPTRRSLAAQEKIEDVGEVIEGARKLLKDKIVHSFAEATKQTLAELPFSKAFKKPDMKKAVENGVLREEDAIFYEAAYSALVNPQKPQETQREVRMKRWQPDYRTKMERWVDATYDALQVLKGFVEADEAGRDRLREEIMGDKYPNREKELADIERRKSWNPDREDHKYEWGDKTTPNPLWVTYEVLKGMGYEAGDKVDLPWSRLVANSSGTAYRMENAKGEKLYAFSPKTVEDGIGYMIYLARLKRGDVDLKHPTETFYASSTKSEFGESGRYRVIWGRSVKMREFDSKAEADAFAEQKAGALVSPIREVKRMYGYRIGFRNLQSGDKYWVSDEEFDTKEDALAYLDGNYEALNDAANAAIAKEREEKEKNKSERKELTADDVVKVVMLQKEGRWKYAVVIDGRRNNGTQEVLRDGIETRQEAMAVKDEIKDATFKAWQEHKAQRKSFVYFDTGQNGRIGEDWRGGKDVGAEDFMNEFGFRGVQFGNWTNQDDRQMALNQAYDAFLDLAKLIGVSPKALSLNGELAIAFGARGVGGFAAAHYEPSQVVINLTKPNGAGSLAHEWWHALDNYFARQSGEPGDMVTDNRRLTMRPELRDAFNRLLDEITESDYYSRSKAHGDYWGRMHEVTARLLSEWVNQELKKNGELNTFLSMGANTEASMELNYANYKRLAEIAGKDVMPIEEYKKLDEAMADVPYPNAREVAAFGDALRNIFDTMEEKVDEESGNVKLLREVEDEALLRRLESEPKIKAYRSMQLINGRLYPPMSAVVDGELREPSELGVWEEAEERPDLADDNGYFKLDKGNKKSLKARYNPYIHSSRTMLNDQFSEAQSRNNLVVVEVEIPESELTSGYKAEKAKDSVGAKQWKAGVIQGQLSGTREVILSRWAKPVRIVPTEEVADNIYEQIKGEIGVMPSNVVTPQVRQALEARGVQFVETDNKGKIVGGEDAGKSWTSVYGKSDAKKINSRFNNELKKQIEGTLPKGHIYQLGMPSAVLKSTGFPDVPIELSASHLADKAKASHHPFDISEIKDLVLALQHPIAVFSYGNKGKAQNVIVEIQHEGKNFVVGIHFNQERRGAVVNDIRGLYPKDNAEWLNWITQGKLLYADKEKIQTLIDQQRRTLAEVDYLDLNSAAKVVKDFENPSISETNKTLRDGEEDYVPYESTRKLSATERKQNDRFSQRQVRRARDIAKETVEKLGLQDMVTVYDNVADMPDYDRLSARERRAKGWYDRKTGKIVVILGNHRHVQTLPQDVLETMLHEGVAHYGLRRLFGERFNQFLDNVYNAASLEIRREIDELQESGMSRRDATEEYLASLAEDTNFERAQKSGWWQQLKMLFFDMLHKIGLPGFSGVELSDAELRYILWRSYKNLESPGEYRNRFGGVLEVAQDVSKQRKLGVGNYAENREQRTENREQRTENSGLTQAAEYGMERSLFDDADENIGEAEPRRTVDAAGAFLNANDEELLERIGETLGMEQALLSDEYDRRHRSEYEKEGNRYWQMLTDDNTSFDDAAGMYANVYGQWVNGGYASAERTKLQAQLDALREWADEKEEKEEGSRLLREGERTNPILRERLDAYMPAVERANNYVEYVMRKEYNLPDADEMIIVDSEQMTPEELGSFMGLESEDIEDAREFLQNQLDNKKVKGVTDLESGKIVIFANKLSTIGKLRRTVLHEAVHVYQTKYRGKEKLTSLLWEHRDAFPEEMTALENLYGDYEENWPIELLAHVMESSSKSHDYSRVAAVMTTAEEREALDNYINYIEYDKRRVVKETSPDGRAGEGERGVEEGSVQERLRDNDGRGLGSDGRLTLLAKIDSDAGARDEYERALEATGYRLQEAWQDSMLGLKKLQEAVAKESGREIADWENAYMAENRLSSQNLAEQEAYKELLLKPMLKELSALEEKGVRRGDIYKYLIAKHGLERNEVMAQRDAEREAKEWADEQIVKLQQKVMEYSVEIKELEEKDTLTVGERERLDKLRDWIKHWNDHIKDVEEKQAKQSEKLARKNRNKDYSGLTALMEEEKTSEAEAAAAKLVGDFESSYDTEPLWAAIRACTGASLMKSYESGLIDKETYEKIKGMYEHYIPLRGWEETTADEVYTYLATSRPIGNAPVKTAKGRKSVADDPVATIGNMADSAIIQGNRNLMKQHFLRMVLGHKSDVVSIDKLWFEWDEEKKEWMPKLPDFSSLDEGAGGEAASALIEDFNKRMEELAENEPWKYKERKELPNVPYIILPAQLGEHQVFVKQGGKEYIITVNGNPRAAQALNGMTNPHSTDNPFLKLMESTNRFMSANFTSRNPAFVLSNLARDGFYSNTMVWVKESPAYARKYNANWVRVAWKMAGLLRKANGNRLDRSNPLERDFMDFVSNGGETGYTFMRSVDDYKGAVTKFVQAEQRSALNPVRALLVLRDALETFSRWAESISRFAAYLTSKEMGRSTVRSVWDAKEISVNFNKKGAGASVAGRWEKGNRVQVLNAYGSQMARELYIFWNAGMQGMTNFFKAAKNNKGKFRAMAGTYLALGSMMPVINAALVSALGGGDDDEYWKLPDYVRRSNICLWTGDGFITIPLPIELRALFGVGELTTGLVSGKEDKDAGEFVKAYAEQVSQIMPLDMLEGTGGLTNLVPSYAKPLVDASNNIDWTGLPIYKDNAFNKNMPKWTKAFKSTSPWLVKLSKTLNEWGGGNKYVSGWSDILNPGVIEYLFESYLGGVATMALQASKSVQMIWDDELREWRNVPVASRFYKKTNDEQSEWRNVQNKYYEKKEQMDVIGQQVRGWKKDAEDEWLEAEEREEAQREYDKLLGSKEYAEWEIWHEAEKAVNKARKDKDHGKEGKEAYLEAMKAALETLNIEY